MLARAEHHAIDVGALARATQHLAYRTYRDARSIRDSGVVEQRLQLQQPAGRSRPRLRMRVEARQVLRAPGSLLAAGIAALLDLAPAGGTARASLPLAIEVYPCAKLVLLSRSLRR